MEVSKRVIARFCRYRAAIIRFMQYGMKVVFSEELAQSLGLTSAQVRKDFSMFRISGKKKAGYNIEFLMKQFNSILEKNRVQRIVILGTGPLGTALVNDGILLDNNFSIAALFEEDSRLEAIPVKINEVPVFPISKLITFIGSEKIKYAIIAVTDDHAQRILDEAVLSGIKGALNLSGRELKSPRAFTINSVNIVSEMENLIFFTQNKSKSIKAY